MQKKKSKTVSRLVFVGPLLPLFLFTIVGFSLLNYHLKKENRMRFERELIRLADVGSHVLPLEFLSEQGKKIDDFADSYTGRGDFRTTIIDLKGKVLGDSKLSWNEVQKMDNHKYREEIVDALRHGMGISERYSETLKTEMLYAAVYFNRAEAAGYFRISAPVDEIDMEFRKQQAIVALFCLLAQLLGTIVSLGMSKYVVVMVQRNKENLELAVHARSREIEVLQNLATQLTACHTVDEALRITSVVTAKLLPRYMGIIGLIRASRDKVEVVAHWNGEMPGEDKFFPNQCWALRTGKEYIGNMASGKVMCEHYKEEKGVSVCIPLLAQGDMIGVMQLAARELNNLEAEERQLASSVAESVSLSLASLRSRESLRQQAIRDPLTGLYNRRYLMETLGHEISRSRRHKLQLSVMMMDVDHFKQFNDQYGHDSGDFVLRELGRSVKDSVRNEDSPCRFGGEEFVVLLPETSSEQATHVAERICRLMRNQPFNHRGISLGVVTVSIGIASFPENAQEIDQLLKAADEALYKAKQTGRDRVVTNDIDLLTTGASILEEG